MDRNLVYPGSIPLDTDLLTVNRNTMVALGALIAATLGQRTVVDGLAVDATSPPSMNVLVGPGSITSFGAVEPVAYGTLGADPTAALMKMGVNITPTIISCPSPADAGQNIAYLIEAAFQEVDVDPLALPYYNAANPQQPYSGPGNSGVAQATSRVQRVVLQCKPGVPAMAGSSEAPTADIGCVGLAIVNVGSGQSAISPTDIVALPTMPTIPYKLPTLRPGFSSLEVFAGSGVFTVPAGVSRLKVTVIGGGGAGGTHANLPSGGGGSGGQAVRIIGGFVGGEVVPITVGGGGLAPALGSPGVGGVGGTSSFGAYVSATGGSGGVGGSIQATNAGGPGGQGVGGDLNYGGSFGTDGIPVALRGGDGGGPGGGRGTSGLVTGIAANGYGGGGGGGGASQPNGSGAGASGGNGFPGLVTVEF